jgi:peptidyl-prolyl cis-trans isomerase C
MKRALILAVLLLLPLACRKAAQPAPAAAAARSPSPTAASSEPAAIKPMPAQLPAVLAKVNGEPIERWEIENGVKRVEAQAGSPMPPDKRDAVLRSVLDQLVTYHLLAQESRARKVEVTDADVEARMNQMRRGFPNEDAFKQGVASQGLTVERLQRQARTDLEISKLLDAEVNAHISVQDGDVDAFYKQNVDRFKEGETVHASHILLALPPNADAAYKQQAHAAMAALLKQIHAGANFAALAREHSQDRDSAQRGGDLGFFPKGRLTPVFEAAAFKLRPGAVSGVIETPFGFHIIKVHARRAPRTVPFAEASGQIKDFLAQGQRENKLAQFVTQAKAKSKVEIFV